MKYFLTSNQFRRKFLDFMKRNHHKVLPESSLIPKSDPSVLFTTAGMQQFKRYYLDPSSAPEKNVATAQLCLRTSDIEEVGDKTHLTLFEMLGNFSFGGYYKEEAINLAWNFLTKELKISPKKLKASVFRGDKQTPLDQESIRILQKLGIQENDLIMGGREDNFWGPTGEEGPCGPTVEFYLDGVEIWNLVFNEYFRDKQNVYKPLSPGGVDTGLGLERILAFLQKKQSPYQTDIFSPLLKIISRYAPGLKARKTRIIADHAKAIVFLLAQGLIPDNKERGYILRRLIRRALAIARTNNIDNKMFFELFQQVRTIYKDSRNKLLDKSRGIENIFRQEQDKFLKTFQEGLKIYKNQTGSLHSGQEVPPEIVFKLHDTYGILFELTRELAKEDGLKVSEIKFKNLLKKHRAKSRAGLENKFKGGLTEVNASTIKLHTAHHLLLAALRLVLGDQVVQRGSNISPQRLRLDFSFNRALDDEELKRVEKLVNEWIKSAYPVSFQEMPKQKALASGALAEFGAHYPDRVSVYTIGTPSKTISKEICAGPHVKNTKEIKLFKIIKQQSSGAGLRRIKAVVN